MDSEYIKSEIVDVKKQIVEVGVKINKIDEKLEASSSTTSTGAAQQEKLEVEKNELGKQITALQTQLANWIEKLPNGKYFYIFFSSLVLYHVQHIN